MNNKKFSKRSQKAQEDFDRAFEQYEREHGISSAQPQGNEPDLWDDDVAEAPKGGFRGMRRSGADTPAQEAAQDEQPKARGGFRSRREHPEEADSAAPAPKGGMGGFRSRKGAGQTTPADKPVSAPIDTSGEQIYDFSALANQAVADMSPADFDSDNGFFDDAEDAFDAPPAPAPRMERPAPKAAPDIAPDDGVRRFNAATQPSYPEPDRGVNKKLGSVRLPSAITRGVDRLGSMVRGEKADDGVEYYTPPADRDPSAKRRTRFKLRNRRPLPHWAGISITALVFIAVFTFIICFTFCKLITGRINYVGNSSQNSVHLSAAEYANLNADLTDTEENAAEFTEPLSIASPNEKIKVYLIVSSDSRLGGGSQSAAKADAIMLAAVDHENKRIRLASIMSDVYVRIRDYYSNKLSKAYYYDTAKGDYTLSRLRQAIQDNFGVIPDNYIVMDFDAFQKMVTKLGGVTVDISAQEAYYMSAHERYGKFPRFNAAGTYTMSGPEALNYIRMRAVGNDDFDRVARQRKVFVSAMDQIGRMSLTELAQFAYAMLPELPTDISDDDMLDFVMSAGDLAKYEITEVTFPITGSWRYGTATVRDNKFTVMVTNFQFNADALQKYLYNNDESYLNGTAANGVAIPADIAPLAEDSPAGSRPEAQTPAA